MHPILRHKSHARPSVFTPEALLREARRQKGIAPGTVPDVCILDPDGDVVRHLLAAGSARKHPAWACYHTDLHAFMHEGVEYGIIGCAVGASFAVLLAEELFASGCKLLISVTSAGQILPVRPPPYFIVIDRALRDEGTSYHYVPASDWSHADEGLVRLAAEALAAEGADVQIGPAWTTDAPFRETEDAIEAARQAGILAVEMESAALYAFATARGRPVLCLAHVTNQMAQSEGDFEKGVVDGAEESLKVVHAIARQWCRSC
ncbi:MAG: nucleoside phosphorylase [Hyphomicrobiaceae bacterium]|nr:nucleoside phosphorylase [Hyphomicrobiaceae bacterium]